MGTRKSVDKIELRPDSYTESNQLPLSVNKSIFPFLVAIGPVLFKPASIEDIHNISDELPYLNSETPFSDSSGKPVSPLFLGCFIRFF